MNGTSPVHAIEVILLFVEHEIVLEVVEQEMAT